MKKIYSKSTWYDPATCELCGAQTDAVHIIRTYHKFPKDEKSGILRVAGMCPKCFAEYHTSVKSKCQLKEHKYRTTYDSRRT